MKKIIWLSLFLFIINFHTAQNKLDNDSYRITYLLKYKPDSTKLNIYNEDLFYLYITGTDSRFVAEKKMKKDSLLNAFAKNNNLFGGFAMENFPKPRNEYVIYSIKGVDTHIETLGLTTLGYSIVEKPKWILKKQLVKYEKFNCHVATSEYLGRKWTALYDNDISLTIGPYKFTNLPGLVLKVYDEQEDYVFSMVKIEKIDHNPITIREKFKNVTDRNIFMKAKNDFISNPYVGRPSGIRKVENPVRQKENTDRFKKSNSNPLELN